MEKGKDEGEAQGWSRRTRAKAGLVEVGGGAKQSRAWSHGTKTET